MTRGRLAIGRWSPTSSSRSQPRTTCAAEPEELYAEGRDDLWVFRIYGRLVGAGVGAEGLVAALAEDQQILCAHNFKIAD